MGDPLSVAASILTLLSTGGAVGKFLKKAIALKHAPDILLALNNDVTDLHQVIHIVDDLLQEHPCMIDEAPFIYVCESLENVKRTLSKFEHLISYQLTAAERDGSHLRLDRSAWLRAESTIVELREKIRADKGDLCLSLTLLTNSNSLQGVIRSRTLQTSVTDLQDQVLQTAGTIFSQLEIMESTLRIASEVQREQGTSLHQLRESVAQDHQNGRTLSTRVQGVEELLRNMSNHPIHKIERNVSQYCEIDEEHSDKPWVKEAGLIQSLEHHRPQGETRSDLENLQGRTDLSLTSAVPRLPSGESEGYFQPSYSSCIRENPATAVCPSRNELLNDTTPIKLMRNRCDSNCGCVCHRRSQLKSPRSLNTFLGSLFVGYRTSPWSAQTCSNSDCRRRSKKFTYVYAFLQWFLARILLIDMGYSRSNGPELCLRVMRVRPTDEGIFWHLRNSMSSEDVLIHYLKRSLSDGETSVLDVDTEGMTVVHVLVRSGNLRAAEFLTRCGAELYYQNVLGLSAFQAAWQYLLFDPWHLGSRTLLREKLWDQSQLDLLGFSVLQKAYVGISRAEFRATLSVTSRSAIDQMDGRGRTMLSWASQKNDDTTVAELLACGADPNMNDLSGRNSLHYAALGSSEKCIRLLLASKADLGAKDRYGWTPLALAATEQGLEGVTILLEFGADMETQDNNGKRPMHHAVFFDCPIIVRHLLLAGADLFAQTPFGHTTLDMAIEYNAHSSLRMLLEARELRVRPTDNVWSGVDLLDAAWYADQETLEILHCAVSRGIHLGVGNEHDRDVYVVWVARWRRYSNQAWSEDTLRSCDADPVAWFRSFKSLRRALRSSQSRISEDIDDEIDSQLSDNTGHESSETKSVDGAEDEETWEDAPESQGELLE